MTKKQNYNLTPNFTLYEYMQGEAMPNEAIRLAWQDFTTDNETAVQKFMPTIQAIRDWVNSEFKNENNGKSISLVITCGFRSRQWELKQGRSGNSQHTICAVDFMVGNCNLQLSKDILKAVFERWDKFYIGGLAINEKANFIHIDYRGKKARWSY